MFRITRWFRSKIEQSEVAQIAEWSSRWCWLAMRHLMILWSTRCFQSLGFQRQGVRLLSCRCFFQIHGVKVLRVGVAEMVLLRVLLDDQGWPFVHRGIKPIRMKRECMRTMKYKTSPLNPNMENLGSMLLCWCIFFGQFIFLHQHLPRGVTASCDRSFRRIELWTSFVALPSMLCGLRRSCLRRGISFWGWCLFVMSPCVVWSHNYPFQ